MPMQKRPSPPIDTIGVRLEFHHSNAAHMILSLDYATSVRMMKFESDPNKCR